MSIRLASVLLAAAAILVVTNFAGSAELRLRGVLANSGEAGDSLVAFQGESAAGMGPVVDQAMTIWERGGARRLNRYSLDGRLLAHFELPGQSDRNDQLTRAGDRLVMRLGKTVFTLPLDAAAGAKPQSLLGQVDVLSSSAADGRVVVYRKEDGALSWLEAATGKLAPIVSPGFDVQAVHVADDAAVFVFGGGQVHAWRDGKPVAGFPKEFRGERPQKIGRYWYSHGWHGTIHRMNERFEPDPGVVLGGASGSFIGYLPQSVDVTNGRGLVHVRDNVFAVSGTSGVVQLLVWNEVEVRFETARRLGALPELSGVALDAVGNIWTPRGSLRWNDSCEAPLTLGDREPDIHAQPVVLDGRTLCLLKKHYQYVQLNSGPLIDASGWSHFESQGVPDFDLPQAVTGAAVVPEGKSRSLLVVERNGRAFQLGITDRGQLRSQPTPVTIATLKNCTSLAWFDGRLLAADDGAVIVLEPEGDRAWKEVSRLAKYDGDAFLHSDGDRLVVSDTAGGTVTVFDALGSLLAQRRELKAPTHVAIAGDRVVVYESGRQRLLKLEVSAERNDGRKPSVPLSSKFELVADSPHTEVDFQNLTRPGGMPLAVAVTRDSDRLLVSLRTAADSTAAITLGVANAKQAYQAAVNDRRKNVTTFRFPAGDWSNLRLAVSLETPRERERFGFVDHRAIHAPFSEDPADWAAFDLANYRELLEARRQEIRITFDQPTDGKATVVIEDADGRRVRNLASGRSFSAGRHTLVWDGLDESGVLVAPGAYRWRGITHPGVEPVYKMHFANGGEPTTASWGPNHSTFQDATSNGKFVFLAAPVTEGGWALVALDRDGRFVQGYEHLHGYGIGHDAIAADDRYLYCAQDGFAWGGAKGVDLNSDDWQAAWTLTVVRYDIESGRLVEFPGKRRAIEVDVMDVGPGAGHADLHDFNLGGLAVHDGKLYVGSRDERAVLVLDAESGRRLDSIPLPNVRRLAVDARRGDLYAATDDGVARLGDDRRLIDAGAMDLSGITVAPNGDLLLSDRTSHQVHRFSAAGKKLATVGAPGGPYQGAYVAERMVHPAGLAFGPDGKLWVTENRWNPKRVLAWNVELNKVVYEKFGMPHYGGDGSGFDPENPRRWIGLGCFWDVDIERGTARPTHILSLEEGHFGNYEPHGYRFFREAGRTFVCTRGKIAVISEVLPDGTLHDLAAVAGTHHFAYGCRWDPPQAYIDAFYAKWPEKRAGERPGRKGEGKPWSQRGMGVLWVDRNGDGRAQQNEFDFCGDDIAFAGGAWGHLQTSLTLDIPVAVGERVMVARIAPRGFLNSGVPDYPTLDEAIAAAVPIRLTPGYKRSGVATVRDRFGRFVFNSDPEMNAYQITDDDARRAGDHLWSYPNQWSDVHGSHKAPLPEPGVMQGAMGILGVASFDDQSDVIFLNGNHGRCFLLTTDGLYLDEAFVDVRVSYLKNEYRLGGEIFGGSFGRSHRDGTYFVQIGHGPYRIYELTGIGRSQRMAGEIDVTPQQIAAAERSSLRRVAESHVAREAVIPGTIRWDRDGRFKVEVDVHLDAEQLRLEYRVQDDSPWTNNGRDWTKLFATGDSVDVQFAADPAADPRRKGPAAGDKRLLIAPLDGKPIAVLYEHRQPGGKNPIEFTSPWRGEKVDNVVQLPNAQIDVKTSSGGYVVSASIPLESLGFAPRPGETYRIDFGATYGDAEGTDTNLRSYWSNNSTGLVDDIPGEIMLAPNLWGEATFRED
ncbi:MAG: FlgD immunoglobulin-like domain containing protein [Pirellulaceae bacterium]